MNRVQRDALRHRSPVVLYKVVGNRYIEKRVIEHSGTSSAGRIDRGKRDHQAHVEAKGMGGDSASISCPCRSGGP